MPRNDYRNWFHHTADANADVTTTTVTAKIKRSNENAAIDGEEPLAISISGIESLPTTSRRDLCNAYAAKMDFRRAAKALNPAVDLNSVQPGEP